MREIVEESRTTCEVLEKREQAVNEELEQERAEKCLLIEKQEELKTEYATVNEMKAQLTEKTGDLEKIIAKLMEFPDLSLGAEFDIKSMRLI